MNNLLDLGPADDRVGVPVRSLHEDIGEEHTDHPEGSGVLVDDHPIHRLEAEDLGEVHKLGQTQTVAAGSYEDVLVVREWNPLEPDVVEDKYYAPDVGLLLELTVEGEDARVELIEYVPGG